MSDMGIAIRGKEGNLEQVCQLHFFLDVPIFHRSTMPTKTPLLEHPIVQTLQSDATEAAWRTAGNQLIKLTREPLVGALSRHLGPEDESLRQKIAAFLTTEAGTAMLAGLLSVGLSALPATMGDSTQRLARELRVKAMADMGDLLADVVMGPLRQVIAFYLQDMDNAPVVPELGIGGGATLPTSEAEKNVSTR